MVDYDTRNLAEKTLVIEILSMINGGTGRLVSSGRGDLVKKMKLVLE